MDEQALLLLDLFLIATAFGLGIILGMTIKKKNDE